MEKEELLNLLDKYRHNTLTEAEQQQLEDWYNSINGQQFQPEDDEWQSDEFASRMLKEFREQLKQKHLHAPVRRMDVFRRLIRVAAIFAGICLLGYAYMLLSRKSKPDAAVVKQTPFKNDIVPPGSSKAVLTLADGSKIELDKAARGLLAVQGGIQVVKQSNGQLAYRGVPADSIRHNTISLPKGSRPLRILLADGSMVWLNVASSITFPTAFTGAKRMVKITGEAYFEVAKNAAMPFYVSYNNMQVKVLGTHFNVNCYDDEQNMKVTLLEGAVNVSTGNKNSLLKPGQQAKVEGESIEVMNEVNIEDVMAWKNGKFYFDGSDIKSIMRQVEKWYDVKVDFQSDIKSSFVAKISRDENLSELLKILQLTNLVHFKIEGKTITVMR